MYGFCPNVELVIIVTNESNSTYNSTLSSSNISVFYPFSIFSNFNDLFCVSLLSIKIMVYWKIMSIIKKKINLIKSKARNKIGRAHV